jgi:hypothetical protein
LAGERALVYDKQTGMTPELKPVWFDAAAAKAVLPDVLEAARTMRKPLPPAARIYYASLALAAGDPVRARQVLEGFEDADLATVQLVTLVKAQAEVLAGKPGPALSGVETSLESLSSADRPVALYWLGMAKLASAEETSQREGVLQLLHIPALHGEEAPELAGAALHQAMDALAKLGDPKGSVALRKELLERYGHTYYAKKISNKLSPRTDS